MLCAVISADAHGSTESVLLRPPRTEWAAFVAEAIAAAPRTARVPAGALPGTTGFRTVLAPFVALAAARLPAVDRAADVDLPALGAEFADGLTETLVRQAARTLVLELNVARVTGRLSGGTPAERFRDFVALTACREGLSALLGEYPVLARLLARTCLDAVDARAELLARFAGDRAGIVATLLSGTDPGTLVALRDGAGDRHRHGRGVAVLGFADGARVVYKPRPLGVHRHLIEVVDWFNAQPEVPDLRLPALLERPGYGWLEHIAARPCADAGQLERFYRRQGAWLSLLHALDGTDLHFENLIACADEPVPVDVETLFHPPAPGAPGAAAAADPAVAVLASSVHRVGLLPRLLLGDEGALDASGLGGDKGARAPVAAVQWADGGTDEMRLIRRGGAISGGGNRPAVDGADADPTDHADALVAGFRAGFRAITAGQRDLVGPQGLLRRFADDEVRVVARATQTYTTLLDESTHPDVLRDPADRDRILRRPAQDPRGRTRWERLVDAEVADLWDGDVPLFTARPGSTDLWSARGRRIPDALERPGLDRVVDKIAAMERTGPGEQEWIIRAAMAARSTAPVHQASVACAEPAAAVAPAATADPGRLLAAARALGDDLADRAHRGPDQSPDRVNWLGLELLGDRYWRLAPAGADLGCGYPGPALFLSQLAALTGSDRYAQTAVRALRPVPRLLERLAARPDDLAVVGAGAFAGLGGIAYTLVQVAVLLDDAEIRGWIEPAIDLTTAAAEAAPAEVSTDASSGMVEGTAGGLAALLAVHRTTGSAAAWRGVRRCAELLADRRPAAGPGFAAGAAGHGWALLRFAAAGGPARHESEGLDALRAAVRSAPPDGDLTWCQGLPGIALAIADSPAAMADAELAEFVANAVRLVAESGPLSDHSLCHGETGVLELLAARACDPVAKAALDRRAGALAAALDRSGPSCGTPGGLGVPGLLVGLSGIGHGLLRLGFAERTASTLLLQPSAPPRPSPQRRRDPDGKELLP
jgi:type 2 lantibiotic biosynthesis protein LanM